MSNSSSKPFTPLAGRPPFATDEPDSTYDNSPSTPTRRLRQPKPQGNRPDSSYDVYDNYISDKQTRQSGYGDLGADLLNGDMDDDSDDETIAYHGDIKKGSEEKLPATPALNKFNNVPIVAPKPGYAAPVSALSMPEPAATPVGQQRSVQMDQQDGRGGAPLSILRGAYSATPVPSAPHPLQPPMTPITPAFARPPKKSEESGVKFESSSIMRGQGEEVPLARRGQRGDEFWRRFSMVVKEDGGRKSTSSWLEKTQNGTANMSRMVWIVALLLIIIIAGAIGFGVYVSENSKTTSTPKALGGSEDQGATLQITSTAAALGESSSSAHVSPTLTVQKRWPAAAPSSGFMDIVQVRDLQPTSLPKIPARHRRMLNRRSV
ncbi:hypothetical protein M0805_004450 [Coniferiporia weirii]|nr:hypothetical protein M0805_004450 [Coniferiporia weirii]